MDLTKLKRRLRRTAGGEEGFSLVEAVVALGLIGVVLSLLMQNLVGGFVSISASRQRQAATALANEVLEQVRAADFDDVAMASDDLSGDPLLVTGATGVTFRGRPVAPGPASTPAPFKPHRATVTPPAETTTFTRSLYVTVDPAQPGAKLVTARVSWSSPNVSAARTRVEIETVVTDIDCEAGSSTQPCEPYWFAGGAAEPATARVSGHLFGQPVDVTTALAGHAARVQTEQVSSVRASAEAPSVESNGTTGPPTEVVAEADTDLATPAPATHTLPDKVQSAAPGSTVTRTSGSGRSATLAASAGPGTTARSIATTVASPSMVLGGTALPNTGLPYARATSTRNGPVSTNLSFTASGTTGTTPLLSVATSATAADGVAVAGRQPGTNPAIADDDAVVASVSRSLGGVMIGDLPIAARPAGFTGAVRLPSWSTGDVTAAAGPAAPSVAAASPAGTLEYWNGSGYTALQPGQTAPLNVNRTAGSCTYVITGSVSARSATLPARAAGAVATASNVLTAPKALLSYRISCGGVSVAELSLDVDLGRTWAEARFAVPGAP